MKPSRMNMSVFFWKRAHLFPKRRVFGKSRNAFSEKTELFPEKDAHVSYTNSTLANALVTTREPVNTCNPSKRDPNFPKFPELFTTARKANAAMRTQPLRQQREGTGGSLGAGPVASDMPQVSDIAGRCGFTNGLDMFGQIIRVNMASSGLSPVVVFAMSALQSAEAVLFV